jgi:hypothetical protein
MPTQISDMDEFVSYIRGVFADSYHHAPRVSRVLPHLVSAVTMYADRSSLTVRPSNRGFARQCWFERKGRRYSLSFVHDGPNIGHIELRRGTQQGLVMSSFRGTESWDDVRGIFHGL